MKFIRLLIQAVNRDKTYLLSAVITICLVFVLLSKHNWNNNSQLQPASLDVLLPDFTQYQVVSEKKSAFFEYLRPFIRQENNKIAYDRAFLEKLSADFSQSPHHNTATLRKLKRLAGRYYVKGSDIKHMIVELKLRIDFIPEALVLAQAANESAWGTSRFAKQANNLFGQWCYTKGCGLVPKGRTGNAKNEVKKFDSPQASVTSYMRNLNSHNAYIQLREIRNQLRLGGQKVTGAKLAQGLGSYSERGEHYIKEITAMIRQNKLD